MQKHFLGLRTTIYHVADLQEAKEWYSKAFDTKPYFDEAFYSGFNIAGYELGLLPDDTSAKKVTNIQSLWGVNDVKKQHKRLIDHEALEHTAPANVGGDIVVSGVKDPWGNLIGPIYNPSFKLP